jgi:hypothetical protein
LLASTVALALLAAPQARLHAQTDYYNTDRGRPIQIEDAYATERHAFELKLAPARVEWAEGTASWGLEPEIAYGLLPRTHVELGVPIAFTDAGSGARRNGVAGLELSLMHNLNTETRTLPALGLRADVLAPVGPLAPDRTYASLTGMVTRTFRWGRIHANGQVTAGRAPSFTASPLSVGAFAFEASDDRARNAESVSRWLAGAAVDRTFPLRSLLLTAELYARRPIVASADLEVIAGVGMRMQATPTLALDAGLGRRLDANAGPWYVTFGSAYAFALSALMPGGSR